MSPQPVVVVGVPVAGVVGLDERGREAVADATLLCGGRRHLDEVPPHGEERVEIGDVGACVERLRRRGDELAVVLATGDPLLFGIGATLVRELGAAEVTVIPAVSAIQEVFARARIPWHDCRLVSAHGRDPGPALDAARAGSAAILCDPANRPERLAAALLAAGVEDCRAVVGERLGGPVERVVDTTLSAVAAGSWDGHSVLLVDRGEGAAAVDGAAGVFGRPETEFAHSGGMITRGEVRAVVLARLRPAGRG